MANSQKQIIINHCSLRPHKSSIQPKLSTILDLFMQNKANFQKVKFNVTNEMKKDYEKKTLVEWEKQSQTKPIQKSAKMNVSRVLTKEYEKCQIG